MSRVQEFTEYRQRMNARIHEAGTTTTKRFFALDERCYAAGAVDVTVVNVDGLSVTAEDAFLYVEPEEVPAPEIFAINPTAGALATASNWDQWALDNKQLPGVLLKTQ